MPKGLLHTFMNESTFTNVCIYRYAFLHNLQKLTYIYKCLQSFEAIEINNDIARSNNRLYTVTGL